MRRAVVLTTLVVLLLAAAGVAVAGSGGDDPAEPTTLEGTSFEPTVVEDPETTVPGGPSSKPENLEETAENASEPTVITEPTVANPVEETPVPNGSAGKEHGNNGRGLGRPEDVGKPPNGFEPEARGDAEEHGNGAGQQKVTLCRKGKNTITVGAPAQDAHLNHGDTLGACQSAGAGPEPSGETTGPEAAKNGGGGSGGQGKVTLCHKGKTLTVGAPAQAAHLRHGDSIGLC
jgi:hypothetical protein